MSKNLASDRKKKTGAVSLIMSSFYSYRNLLFIHVFTAILQNLTLKTETFINHYIVNPDLNPSLLKSVVTTIMKNLKFHLRNEAKRVSSNLPRSHTPLYPRHHERSTSLVFKY